MKRLNVNGKNILVVNADKNVIANTTEIDLANAALEYAHEYSGEFNPDIRDAFIHGAEYVIERIEEDNNYDI